jgi:hypothetical protein
MRKACKETIRKPCFKMPEKGIVCNSGMRAYPKTELSILDYNFFNQ